MIPNGSACQACHGKNGAVENTFVQFYPTLIEMARKYRHAEGELRGGRTSGLAPLRSHDLSPSTFLLGHAS